MTPPLVWQSNEGAVAWASQGVLWLSVDGAPWSVVTDVVLPLGGRVLTESEVAALVQRVGRPR